MDEDIPLKVREAMANRLKSWDSFFDKIQQSVASVCEEDESSDDNESFDLNDPLFKATVEDHDKVRKSLCSMYGVSEDCADSKSQSECASNSSSYIFQKDNNVESHRDKSQKQTNINQHQKQTSINKIKSPLRKASPQKKPLNSDKALWHKTNGTEGAKRKNIHTKLVDNERFVTSTPKDNSGSRQKEYFPGKKKEDIWEQYDLWKLYKRRKAGKLGSVYIVANLDEDPADSNRFIPSFPSKIKKPKIIPRRFVLKS